MEGRIANIRRWKAAERAGMASMPLAAYYEMMALGLPMLGDAMLLGSDEDVVGGRAIVEEIIENTDPRQARKPMAIRCTVRFVGIAAEYNLDLLNRNQDQWRPRYYDRTARDRR